jgi:hypothetical protein
MTKSDSDEGVVVDDADDLREGKGGKKASTATTTQR